MAGKAKPSGGDGSAQLTARDRFWLGHHAACETSGEAAKVYAKRAGLSIHALYQARKRLRAIGALAAATTEHTASKPKRSRATFAKVASVRPAPSLGARYRVRFSNGASLEWEGTAARAELEALLPLVGRLS